MSSTAATDHAHGDTTTSYANTKDTTLPTNGYTNGNSNSSGYVTQPPQNGVNGAQHRQATWDYGGNPLAHANTGESARFPPFAGYLQPGLYKPPKNNFANPAPLGLSAFALTTFLLSLINFHTRKVTTPSLVIGPALGYGGLVQLLAGMWEMATGNTFGATALSSYGGFWIAVGIILTPGGFAIESAYETEAEFETAFGFFLFGWFIFTFIMWLMTLRSTVVFCLLFFWLDLAFLMLALSYTLNGSSHQVPLQKAGGMFGLLAAFFAWYVALAGIADDSNSFFTIPVWHFPWSEKGRQAREKRDDLKV